MTDLAATLPADQLTDVAAWSYSNLGWCVLGRAVETVTGVAWPDGMATALAGLGLVETDYQEVTPTYRGRLDTMSCHEGRYRSHPSARRHTGLRARQSSRRSGTCCGWRPDTSRSHISDRCAASTLPCPSTGGWTPGVWAGRGSTGSRLRPGLGRAAARERSFLRLPDGRQRWSF